ncbi:hypothetical protein HY970_00565 [Candidatus Kaiserbacteria bacterium]|nr:hypothetical protein [Candidatus Kaiserbacteria bacterium]
MNTDIYIGIMVLCFFMSGITFGIAREKARHELGGTVAFFSIIAAVFFAAMNAENIMVDCFGFKGLFGRYAAFMLSIGLFCIVPIYIGFWAYMLVVALIDSGLDLRDKWRKRKQTSQI